MIDFKTDLSHLEKQLKSLPRVVARRVVTNATRKGANVIAREMRKRAPVREATGNPGVDLKRNKSGEFPRTPGFLKKNIRSKKQKNQPGNHGAHFKIGPVGYAYYGLMIEGGTVNMPPRPWMRPAFDAKASEAADVVMDGFWTELEKQLAKL